MDCKWKMPNICGGIVFTFHTSHIISFCVWLMFYINLWHLSWWQVMIFVFSVLRKKAWNYGRLALIQKNEMKWTDMFYGNNENEVDDAESSIKNGPTKVTVSDSRRTTLPSRQDSQPTSNGRLPKLREILDTGMFSWIKIVFTLT